MTDTLTPNKGLTLQTVGGNNNTWGSVLNNTTSLVDLALGGTLAKTITTSVTLTSTEAENSGYVFTGTLTANAIVTFPAFYGTAAIYNNTVGGFDLSVGITGKVVVPNGEFAIVWSNGTNFYRLTAGFTGFTKTVTGPSDGTGDNTSGFNSQVSPGNSTTNAALTVIPRGSWTFSGNVSSDDLTTWMMLPGSKLVFAQTTTGDTHTTTTVDSLAINVLTAGWQVGMSVRSSNADIPGGTTITAIDVGGHAITLSAAATASNAGGTLSVYGGAMAAMPAIQWYQFDKRQVGLGIARSMSLAGTATGGLDGRGSGTADQSVFLVSAVNQISNSLTSYNRRMLFVQADQLDSSPVTANGTNANPFRQATGMWSTVTSRVTPGLSGYPYSVNSRLNAMYAKVSIASRSSSYAQGIVVEMNNNSQLSTQKFPYQQGGSAFTLRGVSTIGSGGNGYAINDIVTLVGGTNTSAATIKVTGVDPFVLSGSSAINAAGTGYTANDVLTLVGGTSTQVAQVTVLTVDPFTLQGSSTIGAAGSSYAVNDILTLVGGTFTTAAQVKVLTVNGGGAVLTFSVQTAGAYSVKPSNAISVTGGAGTGFTLNGAWTNVGSIATFSVTQDGSYTVKPTNPISVTGGTGTNFKINGVWTNSGTATAFQVQNVGAYTVLPSNNVVTTGGTGTGLTLTAAWAPDQASNIGMIMSSSGNTIATAALGILSDSSTFWDGILIDVASVSNNALSVIANPGPSQNVLASIDNTGFVRSSGLICTVDTTVIAKIRSKNTGTADAIFVADTPSQRWQFGVKNSDGSFKIGNTEGTAWTGTVMSITPNGDFTLPAGNTFTANGAVAVSLSAVAPTGASATVQKWLTVSDGTRKYYIPAF